MTIIRLDLKDKIFGRLIVKEYIENSANGHSKWLCECECGNSTLVFSSNLVRGHTKGCGQCPKNIYDDRGEITEGRTASGILFFIDSEDISRVKQHNWYIETEGYVRTNLNNGQRLFLHNFVMGRKSDTQIDHINRNKLDNRKCNLRHATQQQNCFNRGVSKNNSCGYKGVSVKKETRRYVASITHNGQLINLGSYKNKIDAAKAYNLKAQELFGEYAFLNSV